MLSSFSNLKVGMKIGIGFTLATLILALTIGVTMWQTESG